MYSKLRLFEPKIPSLSFFIELTKVFRGGEFYIPGETIPLNPECLLYNELL